MVQPPGRRRADVERGGVADVRVFGDAEVDEHGGLIEGDRHGVGARRAALGVGHQRGLHFLQLARGVANETGDPGVESVVRDPA